MRVGTAIHNEGRFCDPKSTMSRSPGAPGDRLMVFLRFQKHHEPVTRRAGSPAYDCFYIFKNIMSRSPCGPCDRLMALLRPQKYMSRSPGAPGERLMVFFVSQKQHEPVTRCAG